MARPVVVRRKGCLERWREGGLYRCLVPDLVEILFFLYH